MKTPDSIHLLIVHEDPLMAAGMAAVLEREAGLHVSVCEHPQAAAAWADRGIDVVVSDYPCGIAWLTRAVASTGAAAQPTAVLIVTPQDRELDVRAALRAGAAGYLRQGCRAEELLHAVLSVVRGARYICPSVSGRLADTLVHEALTGRESDVLGLIAAGLCNKSIARELDISPNTVKAHVSALLGKLRAGSRTEAVALASRRGLIEAPRPLGAAVLPALARHTFSTPLRQASASMQ